MDKAKILVVDDDPDVIEQVTAVLDAAGYETVPAGGAEEAEQILLRVHPAAAVVDVMMEHGDSGFVLCHEIKRLYPGTPVIILTAVKAATGLSFEPASEEERGWVGADKVLDKPVRPEQLRKELAQLLARSGNAGGPARRKLQ